MEDTNQNNDESLTPRPGADQNKGRKDASGKFKLRGRLSGAKKIDAIYKSLDNMQTIVDLLENVKSFTEATSNTRDKQSSMKDSLSEAIDLSTIAIKQHIITVSKTLDNTKERSAAEQAHSKLTKKDRYQAGHAKLEFERAMKNDPTEALGAAINTAKLSINDGLLDQGEFNEESADKHVRPAKKHKIGANQQESEEAEVSVPFPANNFVYQTYEAVQALKEMEANIETLSGTLNKNMQRRFKRRYKDEMINRGFVPLKKSALNDFAAAYAQEGSPAPPPFWNMKGRREYMSIDELRTKAIEKKTTTGIQWTRDDTVDAIFEAKRSRVIKDGKDPNEVTRPERKTIDAYHAALRDAVDNQPCSLRQAAV